MLATIRIVTLMVYGRLIGQIRGARRNEGARRFTTSGTARINMNPNRGPVALLAGPAEDVILVAFVTHGIDYADHRPGLRPGNDSNRCQQKAYYRR